MFYSANQADNAESLKELLDRSVSLLIQLEEYSMYNNSEYIHTDLAKEVNKLIVDVVNNEEE